MNTTCGMRIIECPIPGSGAKLEQYKMPEYMREHAEEVKLEANSLVVPVVSFPWGS